MGQEDKRSACMMSAPKSKAKARGACMMSAAP